MELIYKNDKLDYDILNILMQNADISYAEVAKQLHVSPGTIFVRMKKMQQYGIAKHSQLQVDYSKLGYGTVCFIGIFLTKSQDYDRVVVALNKIEEVLSCHYTTGNYSLFIKVVCKNMEHLRVVLHDKIQTINGISRTETLISLEESINRPLIIKT